MNNDNSSRRGSRIRRAAGLVQSFVAVLFIGLLLFAIVGNWAESAVNQLLMALLWLGLIPALYLSSGIRRRFPNAFEVSPADQRRPRWLLTVYVICSFLVVVGGGFAITYFVSSYVGTLWSVGWLAALLLLAGYELYRGKSILAPPRTGRWPAS